MTDQTNGAARACTECGRERATLRDENQRLQRALREATATAAGLRQQLATTAEELRHLSEQVVAAETEGAGLVKLYVSTRRLSEATNRTEALVALEEIIVSVVGCERYAVYARDGERFAAVASLGMAPGELAPVPLAGDLLAGVARTGSPFVADATRNAVEDSADATLAACVPIAGPGGRAAGVIALYELLPHKAALDATDRALLDLLGREAGRALDAVATPAA